MAKTTEKYCENIIFCFQQCGKKMHKRILLYLETDQFENLGLLGVAITGTTTLVI